MKPPYKLILEKLEELKIPILKVFHEPIMTVEDGESVAQALNVRPSKCVLASSRKHEFVLIMTDGKRQLPLKKISEQIGCSRLSFASSDDLKKMLNTMAGAVSPLGLMFDCDKKVSFVIDKSILNQQYVLCHPNENSSTLKIKTLDLLNRFLPGIDHPDYITFE